MMLNPKEGRLELKSTLSKPRFSRLHKIIQESFSSGLQNDDSRNDASSAYSSIIEFNSDGPDGEYQTHLRANTLDSHSSSNSTEIKLNETTEGRSSLDFLGSIVF